MKAEGKKSLQQKIAQVKEIINEMKGYKTVALLSLEKLPDALFQKLRKGIREKGGKVKVLRKAVITRVLESDPKLAKRISDCKRPVALILTNQTPYELNRFLKKEKKKRVAKTGERAPKRIVVPAGETELPPGPALSELKGGGINVQIKGGKIVVAKDSVVAEEGEVITAAKAKALQTLGIMPFETKAKLIFGYDGEYCYESSLLDLGEHINTDILNCVRRGDALSIDINYPTKRNIELLLSRALRQAVGFALSEGVYSSTSVKDLLLSAILKGESLQNVKK